MPRAFVCRGDGAMASIRRMRAKQALSAPPAAVVRLHHFPSPARRLTSALHGFVYLHKMCCLPVPRTEYSGRFTR